MIVIGIIVFLAILNFIRGFLYYKVNHKNFVEEWMNTILK